MAAMAKILCSTSVFNVWNCEIFAT